jgi:hypothetical protein
MCYASSKAIYILLLKVKEHTSFWFWECLMQMEYNFINKVIYLSVISSSHKHFPVMCKTLWCALRSNSCFMPNFKQNLDTLKQK